MLSTLVWMGEMGETRELPGPFRVTGEEGEMGEVTLTGEVASSGKAKRFFFRCSPLDGWCSLLARFGATFITAVGEMLLGRPRWLDFVVTAILGELRGGGPVLMMCCREPCWKMEL